MHQGAVSPPPPHTPTTPPPHKGPGEAGGAEQPPGTALSLGFRKPQPTKTQSISSQASSPSTFFEDALQPNEGGN